MGAFSTPCTLKAASYRVITQPPTAQTEHPSPSQLQARMAGAADGEPLRERLVI